MTENFEHPFPLVSVELSIPGTDQHGRAFLPFDLIDSVKFDNLVVQFSRAFTEEDDKARLERIEQVITRPYVDIEIYPGETVPVEGHAYFRFAEELAEPIFACVLADNAVLGHLVSAPPHVVFETATLQVVEDITSPALVMAGLETWIRRVWPQLPIPKIRLREWPNVENSDFNPEDLFNAWSPSPKPARRSQQAMPETDTDLLAQPSLQ